MDVVVVDMVDVEVAVTVFEVVTVAVELLVKVDVVRV